jgi:hypothetical protein
MTGGSAETLL